MAWHICCNCSKRCSFPRTCHITNGGHKTQSVLQQNICYCSESWSQFFFIILYCTAFYFVFLLFFKLFYLFLTIIFKIVDTLMSGSLRLPVFPSTLANTWCELGPMVTPEDRDCCGICIGMSSLSRRQLH